MIYEDCPELRGIVGYDSEVDEAQKHIFPFGLYFGILAIFIVAKTMNLLFSKKQNFLFPPLPPTTAYKLGGDAHKLREALCLRVCVFRTVQNKQMEGFVAKFTSMASKNYPHITSKIIFHNSFYVFWVVKFANSQTSYKGAGFCQITHAQRLGSRWS